MRNVLFGLVLSILVLGTSGCHDSKQSNNAAAPALRASAGFDSDGADGTVPNPAMSTPDQVAWQIFVSAVAPVKGSTMTFQTWASDTDTFTAQKPVWPGSSSPLQLRLGRPTQRMGLGAAHAFAFQAGLKGTALAPPSGPSTLHDLAREEVRRNKAAFTFIADNDLYHRAGLIKNFGKTISFPSDAIEVKTNWLTFDDIKKYYPARVTADIPANFVVARDSKGTSWAMVAMHLISKAVPNWTWATFEHNANPGRCDIIGCYDAFGAQQGEVPPASSPEGDYGSCQKTPALLKIMGSLPAVLQNYCLKGSQTDFTDSTGLIIRLGNSIIEGGFVDQSSCMTCHGTAGWDKTGATTNDTAPIGPLPWQTFWSGTSQPLQHDKNNQIATAADFVWSIPFCAYNDTKKPFGAQQECATTDR
ncbi:MAG: hypothetical protein JWO81_2235 [Alphaproteobacteria bacterium]|nr:hypothetical protein [Alphaproteobacteria bacterium]